MKMFKKLLTVLLAVTLILGLSTTAFAAEEYGYTVTFYAGNQGSFASAAGVSTSGGTVSASADKIVVSGLKLGDVVGFNAQAGVSLNDSGKYYIQGIRLSGRDNDTVAASVFTVTEDADYVVAYGIRGSMTSYTVNYLDEDGNVLAPSQTFYGNVGDKPVVAYQYIEGFVPNALGFTKTLSSNEGDNVFSFVYEEAPEDVVVEEETEEDDEDEDAEAGTAEDADADENADDEDANAEETAEETVEETADEGTAEETENVIVDLDDEDVPMANIDAEDNNQKTSKLPVVISGVMGVVGILALIFLIIFFLKKRR